MFTWCCRMVAFFCVMVCDIAACAISVRFSLTAEGGKQKGDGAFFLTTEQPNVQPRDSAIDLSTRFAALIPPLVTQTRFQHFRANSLSRVRSRLPSRWEAQIRFGKNVAEQRSFAFRCASPLAVCMFQRWHASYHAFDFRSMFVNLIRVLSM